MTREAAKPEIHWILGNGGPSGGLGGKSCGIEAPSLEAGPYRPQPESCHVDPYPHLIVEGTSASPRIAPAGFAPWA